MVRGGIQIGQVFPSGLDQCPGSDFLLAGFQVIIVGRFWVIPEAPHLRRTSRRVAGDTAKTRVADLIKPYNSDRRANQIKRLAEDVGPLSRVKRSPDPDDDFLLAMFEAARLVIS
jgi:hypothetical protein